MLLKPGHKKETHVNVTGSVTLPLTEAVLPSSGWAEGHRRVSQGQRSHFEHITSHYNRSRERTGLCRFIQPIGGGGGVMTRAWKSLCQRTECVCASTLAALPSMGASDSALKSSHLPGCSHVTQPFDLKRETEDLLPGVT